MTLPEPDAQAQAHSKKLQQRIEEEVIAEGKTTPDLGGNLKTMEMANEVVKKLKQIE